MSGVCGSCGAGMVDAAVICHGCTRALTATLRAVPELMRDLTVTLTKTARTRPVNGPGGAPEIDPVVVPFNVAASKVHGDLRAVLAGWARLVSEERPSARKVFRRGKPLVTLDGRPVLERLDHTLLTCKENATSMSLWLAGYVDWLRHYSGAPAFLQELRDAVAAVERVIDIRIPLVYVGPCTANGCTEDLWARHDGTTAECRGCGTVWDLDERRAANLDAARDAVVPAETVARALTSQGMPLTAELIYKWRQRGFVRAASTGPNGRHLFRLGDVADEWRRRNTPVPHGVLGKTKRGRK